MFCSYFFRSHSWLSVKGIRYAISTSHAPRMSIQLDALEDLNEKTKVGVFLTRDSFDGHSIKALRTTFASLPRSALPYISATSALYIGLVRSMQSELAQTTADDMKECISQSVNEFEAKLALDIRGQRNSEVYEEYRLTSELPDEFALKVLQEEFTNKMRIRGFVWGAVELRDSFKLLTQLYLRVLRWTNVTIGENTLIMEVPYLSQHASVFLFFNEWENWRHEALICAHRTKTENWNTTRSISNQGKQFA